MLLRGLMLVKNSTSGKYLEVLLIAISINTLKGALSNINSQKSNDTRLQNIRHKTQKRI